MATAETATLKDLEAKNKLTADKVNRYCRQCGWTYPIPGHAPGCVLAGYIPEPKAPAPAAPAPMESKELGKEIKTPKLEKKDKEV